MDWFRSSIDRDGNEDAVERNERSYGWKEPSPTPAHEYVVPAVVSSLERFARHAGTPRLRIVDIGCGNGHVAAHLAGLGHDLVGVEPSDDGLSVARARGSAAQFVSGSVYDAGLIDVVGSGADCVISVEVVEHLYRPLALFEAARGILRPGGLLIISTPYHGYLKNLALAATGELDRHFEALTTGGHIKFFSPTTLSALAARGGFTNPRFHGAGRLPFIWKSMVMEFDSMPIRA